VHHSFTDQIFFKVSYTEKGLKSFVENSKKIDSLKPQDIANAVIYAVDAPNHVNVNEILIRPTTQER